MEVKRRDVPLVTEQQIIQVKDDEVIPVKCDEAGKRDYQVNLQIKRKDCNLAMTALVRHASKKIDGKNLGDSNKETATQVDGDAKLSTSEVRYLERFLAVLVRYIAKIVKTSAALSLSNSIPRTLGSGLAPRAVRFCEQQQQNDLIFSAKIISRLVTEPN